MVIGAAAALLVVVGVTPVAAGTVSAVPGATHPFSAAARQVGAQTDPGQRAKVMESLYSPADSSVPYPRAAAYGAPTLWNSGDTGQGTSIATIVSFGDPDIDTVMDAFDKAEGLPPVDVSQLEPAGAVPTCASLKASQPTTYQDCLGWAGETDLDVESMHEIAPSAHIIVTSTPVDETEGMTGFPEMMTAIDYLRVHKLVNGLYMATYTAENDFSSFDEITRQLDPTLRRAMNAGITLVMASGDMGATDYELDGTALYPYRVASWPGSDPNVTSVGGTQFYGEPQGLPYPASPAARLVHPDSVWNAGVASSSAGLSQVYQRPSWQNGVKAVTGSDLRAYPDITMHGTSGTSEAAPLFLGVIALAVELNHGHDLGNIDPALYRVLGPAGLKDGIQDVTTGTDTQTNDQVPGYQAAGGYDVVSGWGTVNDVSVFVPALLAAMH